MKAPCGEICGDKLMRASRLGNDRTALNLIEEAIHLLRNAPLRLLAGYYIGSLPFVLGLLYFWADMSRSAFAADYCAVAALGLALLFVWMKTWQAVFAYRIKAFVTGRPGRPLTFSKITRVITVQAFIHCTAWVGLPVALLLTLPFGYVYAFYQNVTAHPIADDYTVKKVWRHAWAHTRIWPGQNHVVLITLAVFGLFVCLNLIVMLITVPYLLNRLLGIETVFTLSTGSVLNTTFATAVIALTYLCIDPILKTCYLLRTYYSVSLKDGTDLKVALKQPMVRTAMLILVCGGLWLGDVAPVAAQSSVSPARVDDAIGADELNHAIDQVISRREFAWRAPREKNEDAAEPDGPLAAVLRWLKEKLKPVFKKIGEWLEAFFRWLEKLFRRKPPPVDEDKPADTGWQSSVQGLMYVLLILVGVFLIFMMVRYIRQKYRQKKTRVPARPTTADKPVDLAAEHVSATDLPVNRWLELARKLAARGELRLALRALYLATLAELADRELITIAKFKSNREYVRELKRRAHDKGALPAMFRDQVRLFDSVWYGRRPVEAQDLHHFEADRERIATFVQG